MRSKQIKKLLWVLLLGGLLTVGAANALVYYLGHAALVDADRVEPAEAIVVPGALVFQDGRVSVMVGDRLTTALELYRAGKAPKILLTGDHGQDDYDEVNTMRVWLERRGCVW